MKKFVSILLTIALFVALLPCSVFADIAFSDLVSDHWAYANIQTLVSEGTIAGFEDGTFRPSDTVTRAQFVKMIGKGNERYLRDFADVPSNHWAYEYIMQSGLVSAGTANFLPDQAIKRSEVIGLLWKRAGSKTGFAAPSVITEQATNKDAVAWAYSCGIVNGDNGVNLRLNDTMSRAEGAALIIRSREKSALGATQGFIDVVSEDLLKQAYFSLDLFDNATYEPTKTVTFGELARATVRIAGGEYDPSYHSLTSTVPFEHKYARDLDVLGRNVIGADKVTKEVIDSNATVGDVIAALTFAVIYSSPKPVAANTTSDEYKDMYETKNRMVTFATQNGVFIDLDASLASLNRPATLKDAMAIAIQLDNILGIQKDYSTETNMIGNKKYNHSLSLTGDNYDSFKLILEDMPSALYTTEFTKYGDNAAEPKSVYRFAQAYANIFSSSLTQYTAMLKELKGIDCTIIFYPSLTTENGNGYTLRVKITPNALASATNIAAYFNCSENVDANYQLAKGKSFYADIASGEPLTSISMNPEKMFVDKIICE